MADFTAVATDVQVSTQQRWATSTWDDQHHSRAIDRETHVRFSVPVGDIEWLHHDNYLMNELHTITFWECTYHIRIQTVSHKEHGGYEVSAICLRVEYTIAPAPKLPKMIRPMSPFSRTRKRMMAL